MLFVFFFSLMSTFFFRLCYPSHPVSVAVTFVCTFSSLSTDRPTNLYIGSLFVYEYLDLSNVNAWILDYIPSSSYWNFPVLSFLLKVHLRLVSNLLKHKDSNKGAKPKGLLKISILDIKVNTEGIKTRNVTAAYYFPIFLTYLRFCVCYPVQ